MSDLASDCDRLILASASPRRRELLHAAGYAFDVHPADVDESDYPPGTLPAELARLLSRRKAQALVARFPRRLILAADTVVAFGDEPLGKPHNIEHARRMLNLLQGSTHLVITGITLARGQPALELSDRVISSVHMRSMSDDEIDRYIASNQWQDKAGGYGLQDQGTDPFVTRTDGSASNIVGLPMERVTQLLNDAGIMPRAASADNPIF